MFAETVTLNTLTRSECKFNIGNNYASNLGKFTFLPCIVFFALYYYYFEHMNWFIHNLHNLGII